MYNEMIIHRENVFVCFGSRQNSLNILNEIIIKFYFMDRTLHNSTDGKCNAITTSIFILSLFTNTEAGT